MKIKRKRWSMGRPNACRIIVGIVSILAILTVGCKSGNRCAFNSDCGDKETCRRGVCVIPCETDEECPSNHKCVEGACAHPESPADACVLEAGCPEMNADVGPAAGGEAAAGNPSGPMDAAVPMDMMRPRLDMAVSTTPDMQTSAPANTDMNVPASSADFSFFAPDGGMEGAVTGLNLTGTYSVVSKVLVVTGGMLEEEQEIRHIAKLEVLAGTRYRLQIFDLDGVLQHREPSIDFAAPEGAGRYQYEYERRTPERMDCDRKDTHFERGRYEMGVFGFRLIGTEDRRSELVGDRCPAMPYVVKLETVWTALP